ncbi:MAG: hypothetical protein HRU25_03235, partial [Psychrobium sp.]|nr:hypothetical protein [Psychrobium sp.]
MNDLSATKLFKLITRASAYLLRGFSRHQADRDELNQQALGDIEAALADFQQLAIENEFLWLAQSYGYINNDEKEHSIEALNKLQASQYLGAKQRDLLKQATIKIAVKNYFIIDKLTEKGKNYL